MGSRLNIEIHYDGECVANSYYHWSAYTQSAALLTQKIITYYLADIKGKKIEEDKLLASVLLLQNASAFSLSGNKSGLTKDSYEYMIKLYPDEKLVLGDDRDAGLIGCTPEDIEETRKWEEARVIIDLSTQTVNFGVICFYMFEDYIEDYIDEDEEDPFSVFDEFELPILNLDLSEINFGDFKQFANFVTQITENAFIVNAADETYVALISG